MLNPASIRERIVSELRATLRHQHQRRLRFRLPPSAVYDTLDGLKAAGLDVPAMRGPWAAGSVSLNRRGRAGDVVMPSVERGGTVLLIENQERAAELAGLLNWCEVQESDLSSDFP